MLSLTTLWSDGFIVHSSWQQAKSEVTALLPLWQKLAPPWRQCGPGHSATDTYTIHTTCMPKQGHSEGTYPSPFFPDAKPGSTRVEFTVTIAERSSFILPSKFAVQFKHRQYPPSGFRTHQGQTHAHHQQDQLLHFDSIALAAPESILAMRDSVETCKQTLSPRPTRDPDHSMIL